MTNEMKLGEAPNANYQKFFEKFKEIDSIEVSKWNTNHCIGFFVKLYKKTYNEDYKFKFNTSAPSKCFEVFQMKKLGMSVSSQPDILKSYIEWIFKEKVPQTKRKFTSISFLTKEEFMNDFKTRVYNKQNNTTINRLSELPESYINALKPFNFNVKTYGDLSFIFNMSPKPSNLEEALKSLNNLGFNEEILKKVI